MKTFGTDDWRPPDAEFSEAGGYVKFVDHANYQVAYIHKPDLENHIKPRLREVQTKAKEGLANRLAELSEQTRNSRAVIQNRLDDALLRERELTEKLETATASLKLANSELESARAELAAAEGAPDNETTALLFCNDCGCWTSNPNLYDERYICPECESSNTAWFKLCRCLVDGEVIINEQPPCQGECSKSKMTLELLKESITEAEFVDAMDSINESIGETEPGDEAGPEHDLEEPF